VKALSSSPILQKKKKKGHTLTRCGCPVLDFLASRTVSQQKPLSLGKTWAQALCYSPLSSPGASLEPQAGAGLVFKGPESGVDHEKHSLGSDLGASSPVCVPGRSVPAVSVPEETDFPFLPASQSQMR
jgi:hypothetical protein